MDREVRFYIEKILESLGYPPAASRVYAMLLLSEKPLTINELSKLTGLGKSTVSTSLRLLEHDGLVYYEKVGRSKIYTARSPFNQLLLFPTRILKEYVEPLMERLEGLSKGSDKYSKLLEELRQFAEISEEVIKVIQKFQSERRKAT